jgi:hypothetical protein
MYLPRFRTERFCYLILLVVLTSACSYAPYRPEAIDSTQLLERAVTQEQGAYRVRASVPGEDEARQLFGIPIYDRDIQPVWLEVTNTGEQRARLTLSSVDPKYFSPFEIAYIHKKRFSKDGWKDMEEYLFENALPRQIPAGETVSGFVFTNLDLGTKALILDVFSADRDQDFEQFTFFLDVPGFVPDHAAVEFEALYDKEDVVTVDNDGLRKWIDDLPCCSSNQAGDKLGRPVNVLFVAKGRDLLHALLRAGWSETSYERDVDYLAGANYMFGRVPDAIFRKGRDKTTERIELGLWLAPVLVQGKPLWIGQVRHAIGRRYEIGEWFLGVKLDPDTNDGRNYILQDLWYSQSLLHWAFSDSGVLVKESAPESDFHGNPWFTTDPYRIVLWVSGEPVALSEAKAIEWVDVANYPGDKQ